MNKKGFTTVELLVSFTLTSIVVLFLFELIFVLKDLYVESGIKIKLLTKQAILNNTINDDLYSKKLSLATKCGDTCISLYFEDGTNKELSYNRTNNTITYGNFSNNLISGSKFGNIIINSEVDMLVNDNDTLNGALSIKIPIYHNLIDKEDFGINILYLYNSNTTSLSGLNITDLVESEKKIYLINENAVAFKGMAFTDPGYYVLDTTNNSILQNDPNVKLTGTVNTASTGNYNLTYTIYDMNNKVMDQVVRTVNVISSSYTFDYTGAEQKFNIPVNGRYQIELWGASGGGTPIMSGKGGYTVGEYNLETTQNLYLYVGGQGSTAESGSEALGGYNGGGKSGISSGYLSSSGGGATDVRLNGKSFSSRILIAGGGGGGGSKNDSVATCNGGSGGGETGTIGTCSADSYIGKAGTSSSGGAAATYNTNTTTLPTAGTTGAGGIGSSSDDTAGGGGGGGYFGGGGGSRFGGGGGGSGYCSGTTCTTYNGTQSFSNTAGTGFEVGHKGNGYIKITLLALN